MTSRSSCDVSALATSSVVVPMLMNSELPFGINSAAARPIARFSSAATKRRASYDRFSTPEAMIAPPWTRVSERRSQRSLRSLRIVCAETSNLRARSSTVTRPWVRAISRISDCLSGILVTALLHLHFDQRWARGAVGVVEGLVEILGGRDRDTGHAHAPGERNPVDGRAVKVEHVDCFLARLAGVDIGELAFEDFIA